MKFAPEEVLFAPTLECNLACPHCVTRKSAAILSRKYAAKFLHQCNRIGVKRVGFTGGEAFLAPDFLYSLIREARRLGMFFDRIMTNGVWYKDRANLKESLRKLHRAGYDGSICISVDAFHRQSLRKLALFVRTAVSIWDRPDLISLAYVAGSREAETSKKIGRLIAALKAVLTGPSVIKGSSIFVKVFRIELSPIGKAERLKSPWGRRWFKEDRCKGPGNVFFVLPDGSVKPCCGYATDLPALTIGNIKKDSALSIIKKMRKNRFVRTVFDSGLTAIRKRAERLGFIFPGKTEGHCFFCHYVLTKMPENILEKCLN